MEDQSDLFFLERTIIHKFIGCRRNGTLVDTAWDIKPSVNIILEEIYSKSSLAGTNKYQLRGERKEGDDE